VSTVELHENRSVLVSVTPSGALRLHRGFAYAPDEILQAIVAFVAPRTRRDLRRACQRTIVDFPVHSFVAAPARRRVAPPNRVDRDLISELKRRHRVFNERFFFAALSAIAFRVSGRMKRRLGEVSIDRKSDRPLEIAISRTHITRDGWDEVDVTILHEMIHQWQAETGRPVDHGREFRQKARVVGIVPRATRHIGRSTSKPTMSNN
jgi:hypothetical protein